jgi:hypothetical protein
MISYKDLGDRVRRTGHPEEPDVEFPKDPSNRHYQELEAWLAKGHEMGGPSLEELKAALKDAITAHRWAVETGGITLPSGMTVRTEMPDQNRVTSVLANAENAGIETVRFKAVHGFVTIDVATVKVIAKAIALHVQACFAAEGDHIDAVEALQTAEEVLDYDFGTGWPGPAELAQLMAGPPGA